MNSAALSRAVIAYDEARCASHGPFEQPMSDRNRETIAPMILAAVEAYNSAPPDADAVAAALVILARRFNLPTDIQELLVAGNPQMGVPPGALASALSSQSPSLSEAREEIERLKADIAVKAKLLTKSAKETRAFWDALIPKGGRCRDCADFDGRCQGDGPPCDPQAHALENLAKLKSALSDLSSLRKGAEVVVKPLEWDEHPGDQFCRTFWQAKGFGGHYVVEVRHTGDFDMWLPETSSGQRFATLDEAKSAAQSDFEARIRFALVSGSREDGADAP